MEAKRSSNFELLRILLIITVPAYHFILYSGIIFGLPKANTNFGLALCSGSAIVADYAFMAMSFYFLQQKGKDSQKKRLIAFVSQVIFCLIIKLVIIALTYGFNTENILARQFFFKGSWWYAYAYIVILLIYPALNKIITKLNTGLLSLLFTVLFIYTSYIWLTSKINYFNDIIVFIMVYIFMGILKKNDYKKLLFINNTWSRMLAIYLVGLALTYTVCLYLRWIYLVPFGIEPDQLIESGDMFIRLLTGKYCPLQALMGIAIFLLFRGINIKHSKTINWLAGSVVFVFLLHESLLCILFYNGWFEPGTVGYDDMSVAGFCSYMIPYIIMCFVLGIISRYIYGFMKVLVKGKRE